MPEKPNSPLAKLLHVTSEIKPNEIKATAVSFLIVFVLMASYFVLRPVRDALASDWSDTEVSMLWNLQFFISAGIVSLYGFAVSRLKFKHVVPFVYSLFALSFVGFYLATPLFPDPTIIEKSFYIWVSAFSLFHVSVFWSLMSDTFTKDQGKRLFAVIAAGASAGAFFGPMVTILFADKLGLDNLMLIAAAGLVLVIPLVFYLYKLKVAELHNEAVSADLAYAKIGGTWWSGFRNVVTNPMLLGISAFILLYVFIGSFVYFEQKNLLAEYSRTERAEILGGIDWIVNTLTFGMAFFVTGRIVRKMGMPFTLALMPVLLFIGLLILAFAPMIVVLLGVQVARRAGNYAVTRPAREMLFTEVTPDERFKSKPVIDIVVYRGGDAVSGSLFALLTEGIGLGLVAVSVIGAGIAAVWAWVGVRIGRRYEQHSETALNITRAPEKTA